MSLIQNLAAGVRAFFTDRRTWMFVASVAIIAAVAFCYFYPDAQQGNVLRQHDMQQGTAIGQEAKAFAEATGETTRWTNSLFSGMPTFQISPSYPSTSLYSWINTVMGLGLPSPANLTAMMMVGFLILLMAMGMRWYVALAGALAYGFSSYFIIIIGAGHIWKFVTLAYIPPTIAGMMLCYRGRYLSGGALAALFAMMQISANHVQMTYYFLFVVAGIAVAFLVKSVKEKAVARWLKATGVLAVAAILGVTANLPSLYNTYEYSKETMRGGHSELTRSADAAQATSGLDRDYITQYSYQPSETFSLLIPNIKGGASAKPEKGDIKIMALSDLPEASEMVSKGKIDAVEMQYLQYMSQYFGDPEGTNGPVYVGALIFALFLLGIVIVKGPLKWALALLTILSVLLAWGRHLMWLTDLFIDYMPMYSKFRTVESILVIAQFTMPLLAAMALQTLVKNRDRLETYVRPVIWCFGITALFCLAAVLFPEVYGTPVSDNDRMIDSMIAEQLAAQGYDSATAAQFSLGSPSIYAAVTSLRDSLVSADGLRSLIVVALGCGILLLVLRRKLDAAIGIGLVAVVVAVDMFTVGKRYLDHESFVPRRLATGAPIAMTDADRQILADTAMNYRVMDLPRFNSADPSYYHKAVGGYHAAKLTRYQDLIDRHLGNFVNGEPSQADMNVLNMLNARYIVDFEGRPLYNDEAFGNAWLVDTLNYVTDADNEMAALSVINPRRVAVADKKFAADLGNAVPTAPGDTIYETTYAPNRLTYHATTRAGGVAVFSEVYFPWGWHATVDGKDTPIGRVDYVLRAIRLPAGSHTVEMWFDPQSLHTTDIWARVAVILIYISLAAAILVGVMRPALPGTQEKPAA